MNIFSLLLGVVSLVFAFHAFRVKGCLICCSVSLVSCGGALLCQIAELYRLVRLGDTAAIYDTAHARLIAACVLLGVTADLHPCALIRGRKQKCGTC